MVGHAPVEPAFAAIHGRPLWAIPWLENNPALTACQLWVGRMRYDAADALEHGCTGLFGIHCAHQGHRTEHRRVGSGSLVAAVGRRPKGARSGGDQRQGRHFPENRIAGTDEAPVYQTVRYAMPMSVYRVAVPNGVYTVALKLVEPSCEKAGERVFDAVAQDRQICFQLDIFAKVGEKPRTGRKRGECPRDRWSPGFVPLGRFLL